MFIKLEQNQFYESEVKTKYAKWVRSGDSVVFTLVEVMSDNNICETRAIIPSETNLVALLQEIHAETGDEDEAIEYFTIKKIGYLDDSDGRTQEKIYTSIEAGAIQSICINRGECVKERKWRTKEHINEILSKHYGIESDVYIVW